MKSGARALGIADSYTDSRSVVAGCVARADGVVDGFVFGRYTAGGTDATDTVIDCVARLDREDVQYLLLSGIAPAWFNVLDLRRLHDATGLPTIAVSYEESDGLTDAIREAFDDPAAVERRLDIYERQPERRPVTLGGERRFYRCVGIDDAEAETVLRAFTDEGGRPEPLRIARLAARAADRDLTDYS